MIAEKLTFVDIFINSSPFIMESAAGDKIAAETFAQTIRAYKLGAAVHITAGSIV
jgi:hypothetical protein